MNFCSNCENMLYIKLSETNQNSLINYCRNCGNEDDNNQDNLCVFKRNIKMTETKHHGIINEFTKLDPTLPRIYNIKCPNTNCISNSDENKKEIIYIRYDDIRIKYLYLCCACDHSWKIDKQDT